MQHPAQMIQGRSDDEVDKVNVGERFLLVGVRSALLFWQLSHPFSFENQMLKVRITSGFVRHSPQLLLKNMTPKLENRFDWSIFSSVVF